MSKPSALSRISVWAYLTAAAAALSLAGLALSIHRNSDKFNRQKLTMSRIRQAGVLLESYAMSHGHYPTEDAALLIPPFSSVSDPVYGYLRRDLLVSALCRPSSGWPLAAGMRLVRLRPVLEGSAAPAVRLSFETDDAWGHPLLVGITTDGTDFVVASGGGNGRLEPTVHDGPWPRSESWRDIVLTDHLFISGPTGTTW